MSGFFLWEPSLAPQHRISSSYLQAWLLASAQGLTTQRPEGGLLLNQNTHQMSLNLFRMGVNLLLQCLCPVSPQFHHTAFQTPVSLIWLSEWLAKVAWPPRHPEATEGEVSTSPNCRHFWPSINVSLRLEALHVLQSISASLRTTQTHLHSPRHTYTIHFWRVPGPPLILRPGLFKGESQVLFLPSKGHQLST